MCVDSHQNKCINNTNCDIQKTYLMNKILKRNKKICILCGLYELTEEKTEKNIKKQNKKMEIMYLNLKKNAIE